MLFVSPKNLEAFAVLLWRPFGSVLVDNLSRKQCPALDGIAAFEIRILFQRLLCAGRDGTCRGPIGIKRTVQILGSQKMLELKTHSLIALPLLFFIRTEYLPDDVFQKLPETNFRGHERA